MTDTAPQQLSFPLEGPGSVASLGRRVIAVFVDWLACVAIALTVFGAFTEITPEIRSFGPLGVFFVVNVILVHATGSTLGHRIFGMRVVPVVRPRLTLLQCVVRAALLCLVIPAVVFDREGRGMHDLAAGTAIIRTR